MLKKIKKKNQNQNQIGRMDFRSEIHNSDRNYRIPIGIMAHRSDIKYAVLDNLVFLLK